MLDETFFSCNGPTRSLWSCLSGLLLMGFAANASAGDIAGTPLVAYTSGGHAVLLLLGNSGSMGGILYGSTSKSDTAKQAIADLVGDPGTVSAKVATSGQVNAVGLMTYGGTSSHSPYYYSHVKAPTGYPYSTYAYEFTEFSGTGPVADLACNTVDYYSAPTIATSFADFFYRNPARTAHPYCLPLSYPRPTGYKREGHCSSDWRDDNYQPGKKLCYAGANDPSDPTLGYLRVAINKLPQDSATAATLANTFSNAITAAGNLGNRPIEGALLTACDYFNTKWLGSTGTPETLCYRAYPPRDTASNPLTNRLTGSDGTSQGVSRDSTPNIPSSCDASIALITDGFHDTTADGQPYSPDLGMTEQNVGYYDSVAGNNDFLDYVYNPTDPVFVALYDLYGGNSGAKRIRTYVAALGTSDTTLDYLAMYGFNSGMAKAYYPSNLLTLKTALDNIFSERFFTPPSIWSSSASSAATNSTSLQTDTLIFQAQFRYVNGWYGDVVAFRIDPDHPDCDVSASCTWKASSKASAMDPDSRLIYTYNPETSAGAAFLWGSLNTAQQTALGLQAVDSGFYGQFLVDWLRGKINHEEILFRARDRDAINPSKAKILGDIVNSDPAYAGADNYAYDVLTGAEGSSYAAFLVAKLTRPAMLYVGANDAMLHGFKVGIPPSYTDGGVEQFAYVPNALIGSNLVKYADLPPGGTYYAHQFGVDGSPTVGDAYLSGAWKTILVGTTGAGAKSVFALDITSPASFSASSVLWEISDSDTQAYTPISADASAIHGDLGYTLAQASIVRLNDGHWAAIIANGYNSATGHAVLFIFNLQTGQLIKKIDTGVAGNAAGGGSVAKNGLSTPVAVDIDNNRTADYVYAGDLTGNLWKFDISSTDTSLWGVAYNNSGTPAPLFVACASSTCTAANSQPITAKPNVGMGGTTGLMVYFGTGKYFELGDNVVPASPQTQTFYALWDNGSPISGRGNLQVQTIDQQLDQYRVTSANAVDFAGSSGPPQHGWYIDLLTPIGTPGGDGSLGERVIAFPLLRSGRVIFETLIPNDGSSCTPGGFSWIMEMDALSGARLATPPWDLNHDGRFNGDDMVGSPSVVPSGMKSSIGIVKTPAVVRGNGSETKIFSGTGNVGAGTSGGNTSYVTESMSGATLPVTGRISWRHLRQ